MFNKLSLGEKIFKIFNTLFMLFLAVITIYPLLYVFYASLSVPSQFMAHKGVLLYPLGFELDSYIKVFQNPMIIKGYMNTIIVLVSGLVVNIILTSIAAYFLSRKNVKLQSFIMKMIVFTMFFSGGLIPLFHTVKDLGLYNTYGALVFPVAINTFNLIIMRTSFLAIPDSLEESAKLDGAGHYRILISIMIPLAKATIAVITLYYAVQHWNSWFHASIFLRNRELYPLQLILREILIQNDTSSMMQGVDTIDRESIGETVKYAVIIVATLPVLMVYPFLQRYFVKGALIGSVKG